MVPKGLIYIPAMPQALPLSAPERIGLYRRTLGIGALPSLGAAMLTAFAVLPASAQAPADLVTAMGLTTLLAAWVSPMQDHLRELLHLGKTSWGAATMSFVQAGVVVTALLVGHALEIPPAWLPFGSLLCANVVSLGAGAIIAERVGRRPVDSDISFRSLVRSGRWFLAGQVLPRIADFAGRSIIVLIAGVEILGVAEGARIASRPLLVFIGGVTAVLNPRAMEAGRSRDWPLGSRIARLAALGVVAVSVLYLAIAGVPWDLNPMTALVPIAHTVAGLVGLTIVANGASASLFVERAQLVGAGRERSLAFVEGFAAVAQVIAALSVIAIGPFAFAVSLLALTLGRGIGYETLLHRERRTTVG